VQAPPLKVPPLPPCSSCDAILYSPEDLSTGLVGQEIDGIVGYTPEAATALVRQILLRAAAN
jgi:hypothetical protein